MLPITVLVVALLAVSAAWLGQDVLAFALIVVWFGLAVAGVVRVLTGKTSD